MRTLITIVAAVLLVGVCMVALPDAADAQGYGYGYGFGHRGSSGYYSHSCDAYGKCRTSYTPTRRYNYSGYLFNRYDYRPYYPRRYDYFYQKSYPSFYGSNYGYRSNCYRGY